MSNIINCIKENVYNSKVIVINNILGLIVNDKEIKDGVYREIKDGVYRERLDNIDAREGLFLMIIVKINVELLNII